MEKLGSNWFLEGTLDYEYKRYILLAYLQHVAKEFAEVRLYPSFSELIFHYNNLTTFQEEKSKLQERFPKKLSEKELKRLKLVYEPSIPEDEQLKEVEEIVDYALPTIKTRLKEGKEIYEHIEEQIHIEPIGLTPLYQKEGYLLFRTEPMKQVKAFSYQIAFFENTDANFHGINVEYLDTFRLSLVDTYESIKHTLIKSYSKLPNPATWLLYAINPFPEEAALMPVAKRKMLAFLK